MPFCRECGGQVEATCKFCPHCDSEQQSSVIIGNDSVHVGDITVNQVDEESLKRNLKQIFDEKMAKLAEIGFTKDSPPTKLTPSQEVEVEQVLEMSEQLASHGIAIEPWHERATRWYKTKRGLLEAKHQLPVYRDGTVATMDSVYQERD